MKSKIIVCRGTSQLEISQAGEHDVMMTVLHTQGKTVFINRKEVKRLIDELERIELRLSEPSST